VSNPVLAEELLSPAVARPAPPVRCTVVICDDQEELRDAVGKVLAGLPRFEVVGAAGDGETCLALLAVVRPDILVLDVNMPGGGPRVPRAAKAIDPSLHILVYSGRNEPVLQQEMLAAGADEFVLKTGRLRPLVDALGRAFDRKTHPA
jgi:DNA-binding NarL/FixJ family response regulator